MILLVKGRTLALNGLKMAPLRSKFLVNYELCYSSYICQPGILSAYCSPRYLTKYSPGQTRKHCCGNICDSQCFHKCFPVCPPVETLLRKQNLLPEKQKRFLVNSETFDVSLCFSLMFPSVCPLWETLAGNNVSATMFPSLHRVYGCQSYINPLSSNTS
jgi:hypothetical protein